MDVTTRGRFAVLCLSGDIDINSAPRLREQLGALRAAGQQAVVVDLADVTFLDSSALGALVAAHRDLTGLQGELRLAAPRPNVGKVFAITRLAEVIPLYDSVEAACD
jgi:anti-sigma B factor antagonist